MANNTINNTTLTNKQDELNKAKTNYNNIKNKKNATIPRTYNLQKLFREKKIEIVLKLISAGVFGYLLYKRIKEM